MTAEAAGFFNHWHFTLLPLPWRFAMNSSRIVSFVFSKVPIFSSRYNTDPVLGVEHLAVLFLPRLGFLPPAGDVLSRFFPGSGVSSGLSSRRQPLEAEWPQFLLFLDGPSPCPDRRSPQIKLAPLSS